MMKWLILLLLSLAGSVQANALFDLYQELKAEYESNPLHQRDGVNLYRDGKHSPFAQGFPNARDIPDNRLEQLYENKFLSWHIFRDALLGAEKYWREKNLRKDLILIVDFNRHIKERRLFLIDLKEKKTLIHTWVEHGTKSDINKDGYADVFSNVAETNQSSLGFMYTDRKPYIGDYGYSLRIHGLEPGVNSNVYSRAIVFHSAGAIDPYNLSYSAYTLPGSIGCFTTSGTESARFYGFQEDRPLNDVLIDLIQGGVLIYASYYQNHTLPKF